MLTLSASPHASASSPAAACRRRLLATLEQYHLLDGDGLALADAKDRVHILVELRWTRNVNDYVTARWEMSLWRDSECLLKTTTTGRLMSTVWFMLLHK